MMRRRHERQPPGVSLFGWTERSAIHDMLLTILSNAKGSHSREVLTMYHRV